MKELLFVATGYITMQLSAEVLADGVIEDSSIIDESKIDIADIATEIVENSNIRSDVEEQYREIIAKFYENGIQLDVSLEEYSEIAGGGSEFDYSEYIIEKNENINSDTGIEAYSSGSEKYYYNTGTSCPSRINYTGTRLLSMASAGSILYESGGGWGFTGHIAIVEGRFYDASQKKYYIRLVEAIGDGVVRSVLDSTRYQQRGGHLTLFASGINISSDVKKRAVDFAVSQLGKSYDLKLSRKGYSANQEGWYCSELVWASYYRQGVDIEKKGVSEPGITPRDIYNSEKLVAVNVYK